MMEPAKATLERVARYLEPEGHRVHAASPGPINTRAASGIAKFDHLMKGVENRAPVQGQLSIEDAGMASAYLAMDNAKLLAGNAIFIDDGFNIMT